MDIIGITGFPIYGWIMAGYFWAIIGAGIALAVIGWRRRSEAPQEEGRYVVLRERQPQPWPGRAATTGPAEEPPEER